MNKKPKVALVTSAANSIGFSIASRLAEEGYRVVLADKLDIVQDRANALRERGFDVAAIVSMMHDVPSLEQVVELAMRKFSSVDVLVNNVSSDGNDLNGLKQDTTETSMAAWNDVIRVNLTNPFILCKALVPAMRSRGWGRIINIASLEGRAGSVPSMRSTAYTSSMAGLIGFSRVLAREVGGSAITVNCVTPGFIAAPATNRSGSELQNDDGARAPLGRLGQPSDVASVVRFFASEGSGFVTGTCFDVNGGVYMN